MTTLGSILLSTALYVLQLVGWTLFFALFAVWFAQGYLLYLPTIGGRSGVRRKLALNPFGSRSPSEHHLPYQEFFLQTADGVSLHTWMLPHSTGSHDVPTILFFHGNAGNIGNRLFNAQQLIQDCDCNVFLVEYRGYGNSTGVPSEHGFHLDALCALDFLRSRHDIDTSKIYLFGRSLGGAVAVWLAHERPTDIAGLIIENTFTSIEDMVVALLTKQFLPSFANLSEFYQTLFRRFLHCFMTSHWRSVDLASKISVPTLVISGKEDELVPQEQMRQLYDRLPLKIYRQFHEVPTGTHNDTYIKGGDQYYTIFKNYIHRQW